MCVCARVRTRVCTHALKLSVIPKTVTKVCVFACVPACVCMCTHVCVYVPSSILTCPRPSIPKADVSVCVCVCALFQVPTDVSSRQGATILTHDLFTNNVVYMEAVLDMKSVPLSLLPLVPLFCRSLTNMATEVCVCVCVHVRVCVRACMRACVCM